jgi:two-component system, NarL family, invasion response regulator UvrY
MPDGPPLRTLVLLDDELPGVGGVAGLKRLADETPDSELMVLAARFDRRSGVRAVLAGAAGYISRGSRPRRCRASFPV